MIANIAPRRASQGERPARGTPAPAEADDLGHDPAEERARPSVPPSTIATRTVALTRPSWRSPTRAWRIDTSVTSNTVTAVSPISCWPMRHAIATSGSARRGERDQQVAERGEQQRHETTRPERRTRPTARLGEQRPEQRAERRRAPRRRRSTAGSSRELVGREQEPRRAEHAPHRRQADRPPGEARRTGSWATSRRPSRISCDDGLAVGAPAVAAARAADRAQQDGRDHERDRVDRDRDRRRQQVDQEPGDAERGELDRRARRGQRAVGAHEVARGRRPSAGRPCRRRRRTW